MSRARLERALSFLQVHRMPAPRIKMGLGVAMCDGIALLVKIDRAADQRV
jgi:hypothetical protein